MGKFAAQSARLLGADRVIGIDGVPERLVLAKSHGIETLNSEGADVVEELKLRTGGRGPDVCVDAAGLEAHCGGLGGVLDTVTQSVRLESDRPTVLREVIMACRKGGTVSIPGVYDGTVNALPIGAAFNKGPKGPDLQDGPDSCPALHETADGENRQRGI